MHVLCHDFQLGYFSPTPLSSPPGPQQWWWPSAVVLLAVGDLASDDAGAWWDGVMS